MHIKLKAQKYKLKAALRQLTLELMATPVQVVLGCEALIIDPAEAVLVTAAVTGAATETPQLLLPV